jgi:hypothetical protein
MIHGVEQNGRNSLIHVGLRETVKIQCVHLPERASVRFGR